MRRIALRTGTVVLAVAIAGCSSMRPAPAKPAPEGGAKASGIRPAASKDEPTDDSILKAADAAAANASKERAKWRAKTFEEFARDVYRDPDGKYIVNGDTPIIDRKHLKEFYELNVSKEPAPKPSPTTELAIALSGGKDAAWNSTDKRNITYCVSTAFSGNRHSKVVADIAAATAAWERCADVKFSHVAAEDAHCDASNGNVVFDVRPVDVGGEYLARAFFPNEPRAARNVLIDASSFELPSGGKLQVVGILRHELGHTLGLRHEHTRPEAGACFEDNNWRPLTKYDKFSVMHYPQCNGGGDWELTLTASDQSGIACAYGPAAGFQINTSICQPASQPTPPSGNAVSRTFRNQRVAEGVEKPYAAFSVRPGTRFAVVMTGRGSAPGDPDLYVRFNQAPNVPARKWDCRPYLEGAAETCALDVPATASQAFVMVRGYEAGRYDLKVTYTPGQ